MQQTMKDSNKTSDGLQALIAQQIESFHTIRDAILKANQRMVPGLDWVEVKVASFTVREDSNYYWHYEYRLTVVSSFIRGRSLLQLAKLRVETGTGPNSLDNGVQINESSMSADFDAILAKWDAVLNREAERKDPRGVAYCQHITFHIEPLLGGTK